MTKVLGQPSGQWNADSEANLMTVGRPAEAGRAAARPGRS